MCSSRALTCRVHGHAGDPLAVGHELLRKLLFDEVVDAHVALRGHEEVRPSGMERDALHHALALTERVLRAAFAHLVDDDLQGAAVIGQNARQVVTFPMPTHLSHSLRRDRQTDRQSERGRETLYKRDRQTAVTLTMLIQLEPQRHGKTTFMAINAGFASWGDGFSFSSRFNWTLEASYISFHFRGKEKRKRKKPTTTSWLLPAVKSLLAAACARDRTHQ